MLKKYMIHFFINGLCRRLADSIFFTKRNQYCAQIFVCVHVMCTVTTKVTEVAIDVFQEVAVLGSFRKVFKELKLKV